ncbi:MAG: glycosyltransferase family 39 protein [Anaerolineae bacterium]|nr:glycosyltransferase family 39 protein [Anaerolineae bacterium]
MGFALWVAFLYAVYPQAILYTRFGFSYALLTPMVILIAYFLMRHIQTGRWNSLAWAGILAGIGLLGDIMMGSIIGVVGLIAFFKSPKMLIWLIPLMVLPFGIYAGINLLNHPSAFLFDLNFTLNRLGGIPITRQLNTIAENFTMLLSTDLWFPLGIAGLFVIHPLSLRVVSACLVLLPIVIIGRTVAMFHLSLYYMSPLFPLIILGVASLTWGGGVWIIQNLHMMFGEMRFIQYLPKRSYPFFAGIITISLIGAPLFFVMQHTTNGINTRIQTAIDPFLVDSADGEAVIRYFQSQNTEDILILASPSIGWALEIATSANVADWQMHVAYIGYDAIHLPHNVPAERYAFIPTLDHADYVVIDAIWRNWGNVHVPQAVVLYNTIVTEWELVYHAGTLEVYARPD